MARLKLRDMTADKLIDLIAFGPFEFMPRLREHELSVIHLLLMLKMQDGPIKTKDACSPGLSQCTGTDRIDRLEAAGFVKRLYRQCSEDRRIVMVELTGEGHSFLSDYREVIKQQCMS